MPKKKHTQLQEAVSMLSLTVQATGPLDSQRKKLFLKEVCDKFQCNEKTAYIYYFRRARDILQSDGISVMEDPSSAVKTAVKTAKTGKTTKSTDELIADLPQPMQEQMMARNPFAQLMTA